jgi:soluble lytic murein transglycosylase-like protein
MGESGKRGNVTSGRKLPPAPLVWLLWLFCFSLCLAVLYNQDTLREGEKVEAEVALPEKESIPATSKQTRPSSGGFQMSSAWQDPQPRPYALLESQGLLSAPDVNASLPVINNRGRVVVEDQGSADLLAAFTVPDSAPAVILPLKISPDAEAVKKKIAAKQQELCDDASFKAALSKYEAELSSKNFSQRANQLPEGGLGGLIKKYAKQQGVDARLVWAVIRNESGFNSQAVSPKGAMGLMQLIPSTAALMGVSDPFDVEQNISGGVKYLKLCLARFNHNVILALAAYNAGPDNVAKYHGCPPFAETRNYVLKVMRDYTGKEIHLPMTVVAAAKGRPDVKEIRPGKPAEMAEASQPSGLGWKVAGAKFKVSGPNWKLPLRSTIIVNKIPEAVRQNPEVIRLLANQNARKLLP